MAQPTTAIFLNRTVPAAPTGLQNAVFQTDGGTPQQSITLYDPVMVADSGTAAGLAGNAPAPAAGDAAAGKILAATGAWEFPPLTLGFIIGDGDVATNAGPMFTSPRAGLFTQCRLIVKASDPVIVLTFTIRQNGTAVFTANNTVAANTATGTIETFVNLTSVPLPVAKGDEFTIDIIDGSSSWAFTAQLES